MIPVIVIFAPTACGKTALAGDFFGKSSPFDFKGKAEIISADSQAVYKFLDIGTAKPSNAERSEVPYHLVDIINPDIQFGLGDFMNAADSLCEKIWEKRKIPVVTGGTGFYIRNFLLGAPETPESRPEIRLLMKKKLSELGREALYAELKIIDPESAEKININDDYRICRALEVFYSDGRPLSSYKIPSKLRSRYDFCTIILNRSREELYKRIDLRIENMFRQGLVKEVENLKAMGITKDFPAMKAIGYREFFSDGLSMEQIKKKIKHDSHRYAKKQFTFMKGIPGAVIVDADDRQKIKEIISDFFNSWL